MREYTSNVYINSRIFTFRHLEMTGLQTSDRLKVKCRLLEERNGVASPDRLTQRAVNVT